MNATSPLSERKHLTRYSREKTSFDGWRVCISKEGSLFVKYVSDRAYGGEQGSFEAAKALRDELLERLKFAPAREVMDEFRERYAKRGK